MKKKQKLIYFKTSIVRLKGDTMYSKFQNSIKKCATATLYFFMLYSLAQAQTEKIDGTTGAPLGGIGAGEMKFCSHNGTFYGIWKAPCALGRTASALTNTQLQFFSKRGQDAPVTNQKLSAVISNGRADDDAIYPIQTANFGTINGVSVALTAFSPWNLANVDFMCYPYAFFQITVKNTGTNAVDAAVAFQADLSAATTFESGKGIKNDDGTLKRAIYVKSDDAQAVISAGTGSDAGFLSSGVCGNTVSGVTNKVAAKVTLDPGQSKLIKFVYAWNNDVYGFEGQHDGMFYYLNKFPPAGGAGPVADTGLAHFDQFRDNAVFFVERVRGSNLPVWMKNQALVTLCNLTNNSMYRKDGRYAHTEGQWSTNGTMDQMFHARQIYTALVPSLNWQELRYWARTQKTNPAGQIHHDIDSLQDDEDVTGGSISRNMEYMCPWDAQQHHDYRPIDKWVDLNCAFIISVYEAFISTADTAQLQWFWPYVKKAATRLSDQLTSYNRGADGYAFLFSGGKGGTENTYDADGTNDMSAYNNSLIIPTMQVLSQMAGTMNESALRSQYDKYRDSVKSQFSRFYLNTLHFPPLRKESVATGPWLSYFLKLGVIIDSTGQNFLFSQINNYYQPVTNGIGVKEGTYVEWAEYLVAHFGGLCLYMGKYTEWQALQKNWFDRILGNRNLVYNTPLSIPADPNPPTYLATSFSGYDQYISAPVVWRNYYTIVGYQRNKSTKELWLEPRLPTTFTEMNHKMTNAVVFSPEGAATINYNETGTGYKVQDIEFKPDNPTEVSYLYVNDNGFATNYIKINGMLVDNTKITKIGTLNARELKIDLQQTIPTTGLVVTVSDDPNFGSIFGAVKYGTSPNSGLYLRFSLTPRSFSISTVKAKSYAIKVCGLNGKAIKRMNGYGAARFQFSTVTGNHETYLPAGIYLMHAVIGGIETNYRFILTK
jgi:uncharacterized protein (DUF608 family)